MIAKIINPRTEELVREIEALSKLQVESKLSRAQETFMIWREEPLSQRLKLLSELSLQLTKFSDQLVQFIHIEMGKSLIEARSEVNKSADACKVIAEKYLKWSESEVVRDAKGFYQVSHEPLGILLGIMPWNFPLWQVIRFAVPAVALGNVVLLKHAPNVWGTADLIEKIFLQAGFPLGVFQDLPCDVDLVEPLIADARVRGVSLTGSRVAGIKVGEICGRNLKKVVLELGGSDPYLILEDAEIDMAARICAHSRLQNSGQSCVSAKRFIVHPKAAFEFTEVLKKHMLDMESRSEGGCLAPLARKDLRDQLHSQVTKSVNEGAKILIGGKVQESAGFFYPATILTNVQAGMTSFAEEMFGPVASVIIGRDEAEMIKLANDSIYGLGGAIFSKNVDRAFELGRTKLNVGMCFVNEMVKSHVEVPFGGVKDSGIGRELGRLGSMEFSNIKLMYRHN